MNNILLKYHKILTIFIVIINFSCLGISQPVDAQVDVLSVKQGLDGLEVDNFYIDKSKKLWVSTKSCLNIASPTTIKKIYSGKNNDDIHSENTIAEIFEAETYRDIFYMGELSFYDRYDMANHKIKKILIPAIETKPNKYIKTIKNGQNIFIISQKQEKKKNFLFIQNVYINHVKKIKLPISIKIIDIIVQDGDCFILTENQHVFEITDTGELISIPIQKPDGYLHYLKDNKKVEQNIQIFHLDKEGTIWLSIKNYPGVFRKQASNTSFNIFDSLPQKELFTWLAEDNTGKIIFCSTDRYKFTKAFYILDLDHKVKKWEYLAKLFSIPRKIVADDFYNEMFVSTYRNLLVLNFKSHDFLSSYFNNKKVKNVQGAYGNLIWGIDEVQKNRLIITGEKPGWGFLEKDKNPVYNEMTNELNIFQVQYLKEENSFWALSFIKKDKNFELIQLYPDTRNVITISYKRLKDSITTIHSLLEINNNLFCGTSSSNNKYSLKYVDTKNRKYINYLDIPYRIDFMQYDKKYNMLWCVDRSKGLFKVDMSNPESPIKLITPKANKGLSFYGVNLGFSNQIFLSTNQGFYIYSIIQDKFVKHFTTEDGLSSNVVCAVVEDGHQNLWISTFSGLNYYNRELDYFTQYWEEDGLPNDEFNTRTFFTDSKYNIYFGGANGLLKIDQEKFYSKKFLVSKNDWQYKDEYMENLVIDKSNKSIYIHKDKETNIKLEIDHQDWKNKDNITYLIDVKSGNNHWRQIYKTPFIDFNYLPVGKHEINFTAINKEGIMSKTFYKQLNIYRKWYEKKWFLTALIMLLGTLLLLSFLYYHSSQQRLKERTKINFEKRVSQLELGVLQAQMNPHFIFNSLNAIQSNLDSGDKKIVSQYLEDFARLMRLFLESSRNSTITLKNELKLIGLYIKLESLRFGDKMSYEIIVDPELDTHYTRIPTMLIQPFVENAINHGLFHKGHGGHLKVQFDKKDNLLCISIIDNGIGRKRAMELRKSSMKNYKSRALSIIHERIDILKNYNQYDIVLNIEDLTDVSNQSMGTAVYLSFPLD